MIIVNAILYLSSARFSILSFDQLFIMEILPYWYVVKNTGNYRKYDIFFNFRFTEISYFRQSRKIKKIWYLRWALLRKCCFSCSGCFDEKTNQNHDFYSECKTFYRILSPDQPFQNQNNIFEMNMPFLLIIKCAKEQQYIFARVFLKPQRKKLLSYI